MINNKAKIISISLTNEEKEWLDDMEVSPTALMKQKIMELMGGTMGLRKRTKELEAQAEAQSKRIQLLYNFIEKKNLFGEFAKFEEENVQVVA